MKLVVVTPFGTGIDEDGVTEVVATGELGELGVRPGHVPLISSLKAGRLVYEKGGARKTFAADEGFLEVGGDVVRVITETLLAPQEVDVERAQQALERATQALREPQNQGQKERATFEAALARARTRLDVAKLKPTTPAE
jgi:F-type H+-transporting ATPase subunit epsilon